MIRINNSQLYHIPACVECNLLLLRATEIHWSELTPVVIIQDTVITEKRINNGGKKSPANFR